MSWQRRPGRAHPEAAAQALARVQAMLAGSSGAPATRGGPAPDALPRPVGEQALPAGSPPDEGLSPAPPARSLPGSLPGSLRGRIGRMLPETLLGGRLDPGRRGAAALAVVALAAALVAGLMVWRSQPAAVAVRAPAVRTPLPGAPPFPALGCPSPHRRIAASPSASPITVQVIGAVRQPGVLTLPAGARVADAVSAAGGLAGGVSTGLLNLARKLTDGEQIAVGIDLPAAASPGAGGAGGSAAARPPGKLDLNAADADQLAALPGVGPALAQRILAWREQHGRFARVDQLREVSGIGERT